MIPYLGILICGAEAKPLLPLFFIIALYVGRDLVIMSYKNFFFPVGIWIVFIFFLFFKTEISEYLTFHSLQLSVSVTIGILLGFILYMILCINYFLK